MSEAVTPRPIPGFYLAGEDGNAFYIMGRFGHHAKRAGVTEADIKAVMADARSGDYDHLLRVFIPWESRRGKKVKP